jgi:hypothetical protein
MLTSWPVKSTTNSMSERHGDMRIFACPPPLHVISERHVSSMPPQFPGTGGGEGEGGGGDGEGGGGEGDSDDGRSGPGVGAGVGVGLPLYVAILGPSRYWVPNSPL